jgi:hypothetical protein
MSRVTTVLVATSIAFVACSTGPTTTGVPGGNPDTHTDGGTANHDGGTPGDDASTNPGDDTGTPPPGDDASSEGCGAWAVGTLTGYNNSNLADDPNAGSVMEFTGLTDAFYDNVNIASVDMSDWASDKYHWVDIKYNGTIGRVGVWDACLNKDCPDGTSCCTDNKQLYAKPGYLLDVETRTAKRLWGIAKAEDTLQDKIEYRICDSFDPDAVANKYGATRN